MTLDDPQVPLFILVQHAQSRFILAAAEALRDAQVGFAKRLLLIASDCFRLLI